MVPGRHGVVGLRARLPVHPGRAAADRAVLAAPHRALSQRTCERSLASRSSLGSANEIFSLAVVTSSTSDHPRWDNQSNSSSTSTSGTEAPLDRKSTRLNSSHVKISYAVFCLKKKTYR